jgi:hypothetical protein
MFFLVFHHTNKCESLIWRTSGAGFTYLNIDYFRIEHFSSTWSLTTTCLHAIGFHFKELKLKEVHLTYKIKWKGYSDISIDFFTCNSSSGPCGHIFEAEEYSFWEKFQKTFHKNLGKMLFYILGKSSQW